MPCVKHQLSAVTGLQMACSPVSQPMSGSLLRILRGSAVDGTGPDVLNCTSEVQLPKVQAVSQRWTGSCVQAHLSPQPVVSVLATLLVVRLSLFQ
jgi:hypothetical protein